MVWSGLPLKPFARSMKSVGSGASGRAHTDRCVCPSEGVLSLSGAPRLRRLSLLLLSLRPYSEFSKMFFFSLARDFELVSVRCRFEEFCSERLGRGDCRSFFDCEYPDFLACWLLRCAPRKKLAAEAFGVWMTLMEVCGRKCDSLDSGSSRAFMGEGAGALVFVSNAVGRLRVRKVCKGYRRYWSGRGCSSRSSFILKISRSVYTRG